MPSFFTFGPYDRCASPPRMETGKRPFAPPLPHPRFFFGVGAVVWWRVGRLGWNLLLRPRPRPPPLSVMGIGLFKSLLVVVHTPPPPFFCLRGGVRRTRRLDPNLFGQCFLVYY
jgi:hypothetical protein